MCALLRTVTGPCAAGAGAAGAARRPAGGGAAWAAGRDHRAARHAAGRGRPHGGRRQRGAPPAPLHTVWCPARHRSTAHLTLQAVATEERAQRISRARTLRSEEYRLARAAASRVDELAADATVNAEGVRAASGPSSNIQPHAESGSTVHLSLCQCCPGGGAPGSASRDPVGCRRLWRVIRASGSCSSWSRQTCRAPWRLCAKRWRASPATRCALIHSTGCLGQTACRKSEYVQLQRHNLACW